MYKKRYNNRYRGITNYIKKRLNYKRELTKIISVLIILILILFLKILNNSISSNIIQIIHNGLNYEFSIREDGKKAISYGKRVLKLPQKALSVLNIGDSDKYMPPIQGVIYNPFGETRYFDGRSGFNDGIDIIHDEGKEPVSIEKGVIKAIEDRKSKGFFVTVEHDNFNTIYGYLISVYVKEGDAVEAGDKIGSLGTNKDGNKYLHFEIWKENTPVDPMQYVDFNKKL